MTAGWVAVVDVSYAQGAIYFPTIKAAGIPGVIIRACNALKRDTRFGYNWKAARDAGLDVAVYGFSNPKAVAGPGEQGAFLAELAHEASAAWVMHDEEGYSGEAGPNPVLKGAQAARWTAAKVERCLADSGGRQVLYSGQSYWNSTFAPGTLDWMLGRITTEWRADLEYLATFPIIIARYIAQRQGPPVFDPLPRGVTPDRWADVVLATGKAPGIPKGFTAESIVAHQFSAGGNGQGAAYGCGSTDLDLNIFKEAAYRDLFHPAAPVPQPQQEDDMLELRPNAEPRVNAYGGTEAAGEMIFVIGDFKRNISGDERKDRFPGVPLGPALSNAILDKIPDATSDGAPTDQATLDRVARLEAIAIQLNDGLGRVGQSVGTMQSGLVRAGTPT